MDSPMRYTDVLGYLSNSTAGVLGDGGGDRGDGSRNSFGFLRVEGPLVVCCFPCLILFMMLEIVAR